MMRNFGRMTTLALALSSYAFFTGCNSGHNPAGIEGRDTSGTITLELRLPDGRLIQTANYTITGPNGFTRSGTINVGASNTLTATIGGLPAGAGFQITITAMTTDGTVNCGGSAMFAVAAGSAVNVAVPLACHEAPRTGSVIISGNLNVCPAIDGISANPAEVNVGGTIALAVSAHDSDAGPATLGYAWAASSGTLANANTPNPTFTCNAPGIATVTATVSDGDPAAGCPATVNAMVNCTVAEQTPGTYVAGDFHNHTTCSDGSISMQKLVKKATDTAETPWGLDWFVQAGHGGSGNRNCQLVEDATLATPAYPFISGVGPTTTWVTSGVVPKGNVSGSGANQNMWRWQSLQEFQYPLLEYLAALKNLPLFIGVESVVAGHEHTSMAVITGQMPASLDTATLPTGPNGTPLPAGPAYTALGNANALAQWEYCFDRGDTDTSRGATNAWNCGVPGSLNEMDPSWNATGQKLVAVQRRRHG